MIAAITGLLACQLGGEILVRVLHLPLPGPVAGMGLMFAFLLWHGRKAEAGAAVPASLGTVADTLLRHLSLLYIPAATGIVQYGGVLKQYGWTILAAVVVATMATLLTTVGVFRLATRMLTPRAGP